MERQHLRVFVACGTGRSFSRLLRAVRPLMADEKCELFVQRGPGTDDFAALPGLALIDRAAFAERLAWADVVVCHGGAGTLYEAFCAGHVPIVVPRLKRFGEHVNDHQLELAEALSLRKLAFVVHPGEDLLESIRPAAAHRGPPRDALRNAQELSVAVHAAMGSTGLAGQRPPATRKLARTLASLARRVIERGAHASKPGS